MATYTSRDVVYRRREWIVPTPWPHGAALGDLRAALAAAGTAYRLDHGIPEDAGLPDDALRIMPDDDAVIISYTVETPEPSA